MQILGYFAALLIGISLGTVGGGGSILTVPVLVYLFGFNPTIATSYSLFIVGTTSALGGLRNLKDRQADLKTALIFGTPSIIVVFLIRKLLLPSIPQVIKLPGGFAISYSSAMMLMFAAIMLLAGSKMLHSKKTQENNLREVNLPRIFLMGISVGIITGLLGIGGGFLIVPALVLLLNLPMKQAVGTSLIVIAMNSFTGFIGDFGRMNYDWKLLAILTAIAVAGMFIGIALNRRIDAPNLKKIFGVLVIVIGAAILAREFFRVI